MWCHACGIELPEDSRFCKNCGAALESGTPSSTIRPSDLLRPRGEESYDSGDEEVDIWQGKYSAKAMLGTVILLALLTIGIILGCALFGAPGPVWALSAGFLGLLWIGLGLLLAYRKLSVDYRLTNQRLIHRMGILRRFTDRIEVIDMDDISFEQGIVERILEVGTVRIASSDRTHPVIKLIGIDQVQDVASKLDDARRKERIRRGIHIEAV